MSSCPDNKNIILKIFLHLGMLQLYEEPDPLSFCLNAIWYDFFLQNDMVVKNGRYKINKDVLLFPWQLTYKNLGSDLVPKGSFGKVHLAQDITTRKRMACKLVRPAGRYLQVLWSPPPQTPHPKRVSTCFSLSKRGTEFFEKTCGTVLQNEQWKLHEWKYWNQSHNCTTVKQNLFV